MVMCHIVTRVLDAASFSDNCFRVVLLPVMLMHVLLPCYDNLISAAIKPIYLSD